MNLQKPTWIIFLQALLFSTLWLITPSAVGAKASFFIPNPINSINEKNSNFLLNSTYRANLESTLQITETADPANSIFLPVIFANPIKHYYVSLNGVDPSDCSRGTQQKPWKTWTKAQKCISDGSIVYFMAGNYPNIFAENGRTKITFSGTADRPVTIMPAPGAEGQVFFNQPLTLYGNYGIISGIDINTNTSTLIGLTTYGDNMVLENNKIHGATQHGCLRLTRDSAFISIINNEVYDCGMDADSTTDRGVAISAQGTENSLIQGNDIHMALGGIQIKGGTLNIIVEKNRIHEITYKGGIYGNTMTNLGDPSPQHGNLTMHDPAVPIEQRYHGKNIIIRNNLLYNSVTEVAISARGWVDYKIYNNTIFNHPGATAFIISSADWEFFDSTALAYCTTHTCKPCTYTGSLACVKVILPSRNGEIKNNIAYGFDNLLRVDSGNSTTLEITNNLYYKSGLTGSTSRMFSFKGTWYSLSQFKKVGFETGSLVGDPQFINITNPADPNLRLNETSPAIDKGASLPDVPQDFDDVVRPIGANYDIGAFEFNSN